MSVQFFRTQLRRLQGLAEEEPISLERREQELIGSLLQWGKHKRVRFEEIEFPAFRAAMAVPTACKGQGAVLYLHGGGYVCGDLNYAKGFGSVLCQETSVPVLCPAYRLAPEFPFPAALEDAVAAYRHLLERFSPEQLVFIGESAGGGLLLSLCIEAKRLGLPQPGGLICISPWTDLTASGVSYEENKDVDPSMTLSRLQRYAACYSDDLRNPLVSPLFADLTGLPESLIFVGGDEIMMSDSTLLYDALLQAGCQATLTVAPDLWHGYVLYNLKERRIDMDAIRDLIRRITA